jgi:hypothetical protein
MNTTLAPVTSREATNFTEALAGAAAGPMPPYHATAMNNLTGLPQANSRRWVITAIQVVTKENWGPEVNFFSRAAALGADPQADSFLGRFGFLSAMGEQINGTGLYRYYIDGLAIPYIDQDWNNDSSSTAKLHVILQNIDTTAKSADAPGYSVLTVWVRPQQAY